MQAKIPAIAGKTAIIPQENQRQIGVRLATALGLPATCVLEDPCWRVFLHANYKTIYTSPACKNTFKIAGTLR